MQDSPEFKEEGFNTADSSRIPEFNTDWDRLLNVYTIQELPVIPSDSEPESEIIPIGLKVLREFFLDAADSLASEIWFDFAPECKDVVDACYTPIGKGTSAIRIPRSLFFEPDEELGLFAFLFDNLSDGGMFAIHVNQVRTRPSGQDGPFDKRGRIIQPTRPPDAGGIMPDGNEKPEDGIPQVTEVATIRAYRVSLKGRTIPEDVVVQICPRFWYIPTGIQIV